MDVWLLLWAARLFLNDNLDGNFQRISLNIIGIIEATSKIVSTELESSSLTVKLHISLQKNENTGVLG